MSVVRVYLPATLPLAQQWFAASAAPSGLTAFAVTPGLREWYAEGDDEELEWAASALAGRGSLRLLAISPPAPSLRVVVAVDVDAADVVLRDDEERGAVTVATPVPVTAWAAVLADSVDAVPVVAEAVEAIGAADLGDDDASFVVSEADDAELLWFGVQELPALELPPLERPTPDS